MKKVLTLILILSICMATLLSCFSGHVHTFGPWTLSGNGSMYRTCTGCGSTEYQQIITPNDSGIPSIPDNPDNPSIPSNTENPSNPNTTNTPVDTSTYSYNMFSYFKRDCSEEGSTLRYNGKYNKISVFLGSEADSDPCTGKTIIIPARVTDVKFIGLSTGSPLSNVRIEFEERVNTVNLSFCDVRIETDGTILTSESRNIQFNIEMTGGTCSFTNTSYGKTGYAGKDATDRSEGDDVINGSQGGKGSSAFHINGRVTINSSASLLIIQGGNGGAGGRGGHIVTGAAPNGGKGGAGGAAILAEDIVNVYVAPKCNAHISGGKGGAGGAGGTSRTGHWGSNRNGAAGEPGPDGDSGCNIIMQ